MSASGFFQWRTSGGKQVKTNLPLLDFPYSKLPAADESATAARLWRTVSEPVVCNRGNPSEQQQDNAGQGRRSRTTVNTKQGGSTARVRATDQIDGTHQTHRNKLNGSGI